MVSKAELRKALRTARAAHVTAQPEAIRGLLFHRPPAPLVAKIGTGAVIGLYHAMSSEAPAAAYARFFLEAGHKISLPHFADESSSLTFREHTDPFGGSDLAEGPFGIMQPSSEATTLVPDVLFIPLVGFTENLDRLGQGGGHYDRWLAEHPGRMTIGLAWDVQLIEPADELPIEPHDMGLDAVVTPTRLYGLN